MMTNYRRNRLPGATYFFTLTIAQRHLDLLIRHVQDLKTAFREEHQRAGGPVDERAAEVRAIKEG